MGTWLKLVAWVTVVVGGLLLALNLLFFEVWRIPTDDPLLAASIQPTLTAGDLVVVTRHTTVGRGDLLRCADPDAPGRFVVARAMAHFGEEIEMNEEVVSLDSHRTPSPRACEPPYLTLQDPRDEEDAVLMCSVEDFGDMPFSVLRSRQRPEHATKATVEGGRWFLVSDDRHIHLDSRDFGQIDPNTCSHVVFRIVGAEGFGDRKSRLTIIW